MYQFVLGDPSTFQMPGYCIPRNRSTNHFGIWQIRVYIYTCVYMYVCVCAKSADWWAIYFQRIMHYWNLLHVVDLSWHGLLQLGLNLKKYPVSKWPHTLMTYCRNSWPVFTRNMVVTQPSRAWWKTGIEAEELVGTVAIDLSKAFDSLPYSLLIAKLAGYDIHLSACKLSSFTVIFPLAVSSPNNVYQLLSYNKQLPFV